MPMTIPSSSFAPVTSVMTDQKTLFVIPAFQRPYAWEERQIDDLIHDITNKSRTTSPQHYFSPIHLIEITPRQPAQSSDFDFKQYLDQECEDINALLNSAPSGNFFCNNLGEPIYVFLVIDGQQRLTTFLMLYHLYYLHCGHSLNSLSTTLHHGHTVPRVIQNPPGDHRFMRSVLNHYHYASRTAIPNPTRQSQRNLLNAANRLHAWIGTGTLPNPFPLLQSTDFKTALMVLDPSFALTSFMTLNDRGKDLTVLEKFKALLMEYDLHHSGTTHCTRIHTVFGKLYQVLDESIHLGLISPRSRADDRFMQLLSAYVRGGADPEAQWQDGGTAYTEFFVPALECATGGSPRNFSCSHSLVSGKLASNLIAEWLSQIDEVVDGLDHLNGIVAGTLFGGTPSIFYPSSRTLADDYRVIFNSLTVSPATLALLLKFRANTKAEWHDRFPVPCTPNPGIFQILQDALSRIDTQHPHTEKVIEEIRNKIAPISPHGGPVDLSMLDVAERIELSVWTLGAPRVNFAQKWNATATTTNAPNFVQTWSLWWINTHAFLYTVTNGSNERLFRYILREKEASFGTNIHLNNDLELEHIFPQTPGHWSIISYGFPDPTDYNRFIGKIGNMTFLYKPCNVFVGSNPPDLKATHYTSCPGHPVGTHISSALRIVSDLGNTLQPLGTSLPEYRKVLDARCVELAVFCLQRFPSV